MRMANEMLEKKIEDLEEDKVERKGQGNEFIKNEQNKIED
jgi:hypothetical protein